MSVTYRGEADRCARCPAPPTLRLCARWSDFDTCAAHEGDVFHELVVAGVDVLDRVVLQSAPGTAWRAAREARR